MVNTKELIENERSLDDYNYVPPEELEPGSYLEIGAPVVDDTVEVQMLKPSPDDLAYECVCAVFPAVADTEGLTDAEKAYWRAFITLVSELIIKGSDYDYRFLTESAMSALHERLSSHQDNVVPTVQDFYGYVYRDKKKFTHPLGVKDVNLHPDELLQRMLKKFNRRRTHNREPVL